MMQDDLLFRSITGRATAEEQASVLVWRSEAAENERRYQDLRRVLMLVAEAERQHASPPRPSAADIVSLASQQDSGPQLPEEPSRPGSAGWRRPLRGAAALLAAAAVLVLMLRPSGPDYEASSTVNEFATGRQEPGNVVLSDGTVVRLAGLSRLRVPAAQDREVSLVGRAYFAVKSDQARPFIVHTTVGDVRVLGTQFALETAEEELRLIVVEGSVALLVDGVETEVRANQMVRYARGTTLPVVDVPNARALTSWVGTFLAFRDTPLREVVRQVGEVYGVPIEMDSSLANRTLTAWFADWTLEEVIEAVCMVASAHCEVREDLVTVFPR